jgi:hypothetical protein
MYRCDAGYQLAGRRSAFFKGNIASSFEQFVDGGSIYFPSNLILLSVALNLAVEVVLGWRKKTRLAW